MAAATNNTANVSPVKGIKGGYLFSAPAGTTLPTTAAPTLDAAFVNLGYIPEDGAPNFSDEISSTTYKDINGQTIAVDKESEEESFTITLCEIKPDVWKEYYGQDNVTVSSDGKTMTAFHKGADTSSRVYVFLMQLKDGRKWCRVVPEGVVSSLGDEAPFDGIYSRELTYDCLTTDNGSMIDYVELKTA